MLLRTQGDAQELFQLRQRLVRAAVEDGVIPTASAPTQFSFRSSTKTHSSGEAHALAAES